MNVQSSNHLISEGTNNISILCMCVRKCCRWLDAGKFLTGFSAVGSIAIPAILAHAQVNSLVWYWGRQAHADNRQAYCTAS